MVYNKESALKIAESLLQIKAIKLQPTNPFVWSSGWKSPIYCDNRKTLSYPPVRTYIRQQFVEAIQEHFPNANTIVGVATGGIAIGALVAEALGLPFAYVRSKEKGHGMQNLIEGEIIEGSNTVVIEDLISTGASSLKAVEALKNGGHKVLGMAAIFTYGLNVAQQNFEKNNCKLITLSDYDLLIRSAINSNHITDENVSSLNEWKKDPANWNNK